MDEQCENCRFWSAQTGRDSFGWCRRRAPVTAAIKVEADGPDSDDDRYAAWPLTYEADWCGEYERTTA